MTSKKKSSSNKSTPQKNVFNHKIYSEKIANANVTSLQSDWAELQKQAKLKFEKKQIRRQILDDYLKFRSNETGDDSLSQVSNFIIKYEHHHDLMQKVLEQFKNSGNLLDIRVWQYLSGDPDELVNDHIRETRILGERKQWLETRLPNPIILSIGIASEGPLYDSVTFDKLNKEIEKYIEIDNLRINMLPSVSSMGEYSFQLQFLGEPSISWNLKLSLAQADLPPDCISGLIDAVILPGANEQDLIDWLRQYLDEVSSDNILTYYPLMGKVLRTAYEYGYWESPWVQSILQSWRSGKDEYELLKSSSNEIKEKSRPILSPAIKTLQESEKLVQRILIKCEVENDVQPPLNLNSLVNKSKGVNFQSDHKPANWFLQLAKLYFDKNGQDSLYAFSLIQYCFWQGSQYFLENKRPESRPFFLSCIHLHSIYGNKVRGIHQDAQIEFFRALAFYLGTYKNEINITSSLSIEDDFYAEWINILTKQVNNKSNLEPLGKCIVEITVANKQFMFDLVNRMQFRKGAETAVQTIVKSLQEPIVFNLDPLLCLQLLGRLQSDAIILALTRFKPKTTDERRLLALALLDYAKNHKSDLDNFLKGFASKASSETKTTLAFSLLVEPFVSKEKNNEGELKANIMAQLFGLDVGTKSTEKFLGVMLDLANAFDSFSSSSDSHVKGSFGYNILDTIRRTRLYLMQTLPAKTQGDIIVQFYRRVEAHVTAEQAKLIHDTTLEIKLMNDRVPFSSTDTRITVEIRNVGEGTALALELEVNPVKNHYKVEERHRIQKIDTIEYKQSLQKDIRLQPTVDFNEVLNLSVELRYDTFKNKDKIAYLEENDRTVKLYPIAQFVQIQPPYNIGAPATTWFYGRKNILDGMADNLRDGPNHDTSMIIYGLRRAGKTSIVKRFIEYTIKEKERHLGTGYISIYADLLYDGQHKKIKNNDDFLRFIMEIILDTLAKSDDIKLDTSLFIDDLNRNGYDGFSKGIENILAKIAPQRLLIVLDEFSVINSLMLPTNSKETYLTSDVFSFLSNIIQHNSQLTFIFTGTYILFEMMREYAFDLAKICKPRLVGFLDDNSARRLVEEPVLRDENHPERGWLEYAPRVVDRIVTVTNCHPYLIQYLCMDLVDRMNRLNQNTVNLRDIDEIIDDVISSPAHETPMLLLWNEFDTHQHKVLSVIADKMRVDDNYVELEEIIKMFEILGDFAQPDDILRTCQSLADALLLEKAPSTESPEYKITIPIYQRWLKQNKSVKVVFRNSKI